MRRQLNLALSVAQRAQRTAPCSFFVGQVSCSVVKPKRMASSSVPNSAAEKVPATLAAGDGFKTITEGKAAAYMNATAV
jgi:hypothetical protein